MPDNTELLTRYAEKLGRAQLEVDRLAEENGRLHLLHDSHPENQALWMALMFWSCKCTDDAEKQVEGHLDPENHDSNCDYREACKSVKEAVKR